MILPSFKRNAFGLFICQNIIEKFTIEVNSHKKTIICYQASNHVRITTRKEELDNEEYVLLTAKFCDQLCITV